MKARAWVPWLFVIVAGVAACGSSEPSNQLHPERAPASDPSPRAAEAAAPAALRSAYIAAVQTNASADYRVAQTGGAIRATTTDQGFRADFTPRGVAVMPEIGSWTFQLAPSRWGCKGSLAEVPHVPPEAQGNRVDYAHPGLHAWYLNGPLGLEQGFTLEASPCQSGGGSVVIELGHGADLRAEVSARGDTAALRDARGAEVLRYSDLYVVDATGQKLAARLGGAPESLSIEIDDAGAVYPIEVDPLLWTQEQELLGTGEFGRAVAMDGNTALVQGGGNVYIFAHRGSFWKLQQVLTAPDEADSEFGFSVALGGDTVAVGAIFAADRGAVYVFSRQGGRWTLQQTLTPNGGPTSARFGWSLAVTGNTLFVGDLNLGPSSVHVFARTGATWTLQQTLTAPDSTGIDDFGNAIAAQGDTVVIGSPGYPTTEFPTFSLFQGAAYIFGRSSGGLWTPQQRLTNINGQPFYNFGAEVAVQGDTVLVGETGFSGRQGAAYVFGRAGGMWTQQQQLTASDGEGGDLFGAAVSVSGNTAVVGALNALSGNGAAYVFSHAGGTWTQRQELTASGGEAGDLFGAAVAVGGVTTLVGAFGHDSFDGAAYFFSRSGPP
ncbi:hypothetical protein [Sorangium sp. So ce124]|uniref:hypothetical protein n=1 Tax=Sorangium sp. So ce124 TaxID=3133280 RepID=UPI003F61333E